MLLCQIRLILIILIWFGKREKVPFFEVSEQFSFHVSKDFCVSKAQQTRAWLLSIVIADVFDCLNNGAKPHVFGCFGFSGTKFV